MSPILHNPAIGEFAWRLPTDPRQYTGQQVLPDAASLTIRPADVREAARARRLLATG